MLFPVVPQALMEEFVGSRREVAALTREIAALKAELEAERKRRRELNNYLEVYRASVERNNQKAAVAAQYKDAEAAYVALAKAELAREHPPTTSNWKS